MVIDMKDKVNSIYDITKFILSITIVIIHSGFLKNVLYPYLRIAVPLFFIISSYFLFKKVNKVKVEERPIIIKNFIKRNMILYLFWFIVLLPVTLDIKRYFTDYSILKGLIILLRDYLFSSTFSASWFIMALIEGVIIVYLLTRKKDYKVYLWIFIIIYLVVTLFSSYKFILPKSLLDNKIFYYFHLIMISPWNSFLVSLIWIYIGKMFADNRININVKTNIFLLVLSLLAMWGEWYLVKYYSHIFNYDCYILLIPTVILIFNLLNNYNFYFKKSILLRNLSTIIYTTHASIIHILTIDSDLVQFTLTLSICLIGGLIIIYLSKKRFLSILKYAY